ncbi:DinB family protein [Mucilaginibacter glaciei]|uniref:DinB family protein n=1 Tax=Mucilaginibacter glaciei TaxID=2772109 RepID=A0A926P136_9SPHI|nr:DinB family protein [Mucilaginibacter glaciei]MBD1395389.1 DinB family protein [Mucilaginibacter glaciei]
MQTTLLRQYQLVTGARAALFNYCETVRNDDLLTPLPSFNDESMISQMTHVANCYLFWLAHYAMQDHRPFFQNQANKSMNDVKQDYEQVNMMINEFLHKYGQALDVPITFLRHGNMLTTTPLQVFTHVTTHEFHHKGQVLNMSRQLGYIPADTDVIRT